jgi:hypothetical protein
VEGKFIVAVAVFSGSVRPRHKSLLVLFFRNELLSFTCLTSAHKAAARPQKQPLREFIR